MIGTKKAAFKTGQRLEYLRDRTVTTTVNGKEVPYIHKGMLVTVIETKPPEKGIGFIKYDEDGEALIDHDTCGYNVYENDFGQRRLIWPDCKKDWKIIKDETIKA